MSETTSDFMVKRLQAARRKISALEEPMVEAR